MIEIVVSDYEWLWAWHTCCFQRAIDVVRHVTKVGTSGGKQSGSTMTPLKMSYRHCNMLEASPLSISIFPLPGFSDFFEFATIASPGGRSTTPEVNFSFPDDIFPRRSWRLVRLLNVVLSSLSPAAPRHMSKFNSGLEPCVCKLNSREHGHTFRTHAHQVSPLQELLEAKSRLYAEERFTKVALILCSKIARPKKMWIKVAKFSPLYYRTSWNWF